MALPSFSPEAADALPAGEGGAHLDHYDTVAQRYTPELDDSA
jgi:hypothetical protein